MYLDNVIEEFKRVNQAADSETAAIEPSRHLFAEQLLQFLLDDCERYPDEDIRLDTPLSLRSIWELVLVRKIIEESEPALRIWAKKMRSNKEVFFLKLYVDRLRSSISIYLRWANASWLQAFSKPVAVESQFTIEPFAVSDREGNGTVQLRRRKSSLFHSIWELIVFSESATAHSEQKIVELLEGYAVECGVGIFAEYISARWAGCIQPVGHPPGKQLEQFIGYIDIREQLIVNTQTFLRGKPALNVLLYGDRGTGKSSTVHALVNRFWQQRLRLIEVDRAHYETIPGLFAVVANLPYSFIILLDDLSFDEGESEYKTLKAALDGGAQSAPGNVVIYATSNRRHLLQESFSDKNDVHGDDIRRYDTIQEKMSLSDRFGLILSFYSPSQTEYLDIVKGLAAQHQLEVNQQLIARALRFEREHAGRSPRVAEQFVSWELSQR
ncbi:MAG: putative ATPase superfamily [Bacilli bacterium]|nr:putative ATPase superfamily [Bacilli bacterium]